MGYERKRLFRIRSPCTLLRIVAVYYLVRVRVGVGVGVRVRVRVRVGVGVRVRVRVRPRVPAV